MRALLALLAVTLAVPAQAQGQLCGKYSVFVKGLESKYGETSKGKGLAGDTYVIELFASEKTFTVLATTPNGNTCIIAAGKGWQDVKPTIPGDDL